MKLTLKEVLVLVLFCSGIASTWAVTIYKVSALETQVQRINGTLQALKTQVQRINGTLQWILAEGILEGRYQNAPSEWIEPD